MENVVSKEKGIGFEVKNLVARRKNFVGSPQGKQIVCIVLIGSALVVSFVFIP